MKLHLSGVKLPKLGTLQDRVYRDYLTRETRASLNRDEFLMMTALTNPKIEDPAKQRQWLSSIKEMWTRYVSASFGIEFTQKDAQDLKLREFYEDRVKPAQLKMARGRDGNVFVEGIESIFGQPSQGKSSSAPKPGVESLVIPKETKVNPFIQKPESERKPDAPSLTTKRTFGPMNPPSTLRPNNPFSPITPETGTSKFSR